jgi:hypothetical protein
MLLWAVVLLLDASGPGTPPAPPGCLFVPSGSDRLITSDGDVFRVVCAGGGGAGGFSSKGLLSAGARRKFSSFRRRLGL